MNDQQFDRLLKASLSWQADRAIDQQPRRLAMRRLAVRLGGTSSASLRPRVVMLPAASTLNLIALLLILLVLIGGALLIGSLLLRDPLPRPGPFGLATDCDVVVREGVVVEVATGSGTTWLMESGALVTDESVSASTYEETMVGSSYTEWSLNERGVELMLGRIAEASIGPGCRQLRTREAGGEITVAADSAASRTSWGLGGIDDHVRPLVTVEAEQTLVDLVAALEQPEAWLPEEAFATAGQRRSSPQSWLVTVLLQPTDLPPGARITLGGGLFLDGTDPRYDQVALPGSEPALEFGEPGPPGLSGTGSENRCAPVDPEAALGLARSLDALRLTPYGTDDQENPLHTPDLAYEVFIGLSPVIPEGLDCDALFARYGGSQASPPPPRLVEGNLADIDPCSLLNPTAAAEILGTDSFATERSTLVLGVPAFACAVYAADDDPGLPPEIQTLVGRKVTVTLYPRTVTKEEGGVIAEALFGDGAVEGLMARNPAWENACIAADHECKRAIAAWARQRLVVFEFVSNRWLPAGAQTPSDVAREFVEATLQHLTQ